VRVILLLVHSPRTFLKLIRASAAPRLRFGEPSDGKAVLLDAGYFSLSTRKAKSRRDSLSSPAEEEIRRNPTFARSYLQTAFFPRGRYVLPAAYLIPSSAAISRHGNVYTFRIARVASTSSLAPVRYCAVGEVCVRSSITELRSPAS